MRTITVIENYAQNVSNIIRNHLMIYFSYIIFIFLYSTNIYSQPGTTITVINAGTADCNGIYEMMASVDGHDAYLKDFPNGDILSNKYDKKYFD